MDTNIIGQNLMVLRCNLLIHDTLGFWWNSKNGKFIDVFKNVIKIRDFRWEENGKILNLSEEEILFKSIDCITTAILAQITCYIYEIASKNPLNLSDNNFSGKENVQVSSDICTDYQLLNFIRNAISHNNDMDDRMLYKFSHNDRNYTFLLNREGSENSKVVIEKKELMDFLDSCLTLCREKDDKENFLNGNLSLNLKNIYSKFPLENVNDFIKLEDVETKESIERDENQKKIIFDLVKYLREHNVESHRCVKLCYPYRQNILNNCLRMYDFFFLITGLYNHQESTYNEYMKFLIKFGTYYDRADIVQKYDIPGMFLVNRLFHIFSTTSNENLEHNEMVDEFEKINKLRNSIIHGTFYKGFDGTFYFYDAPRKKKNEKELKYIDKLTIEDFRSINWKLFLAKNITKYSENSSINKEEYDRLFLEDIIRRISGMDDILKMIFKR